MRSITLVALLFVAPLASIEARSARGQDKGVDVVILLDISRSMPLGFAPEKLVNGRPVDPAVKKEFEQFKKEFEEFVKTKEGRAPGPNDTDLANEFRDLKFAPLRGQLYRAMVRGFAEPTKSNVDLITFGEGAKFRIGANLGNGKQLEELEGVIKQIKPTDSGTDILLAYQEARNAIRKKVKLDPKGLKGKHVVLITDGHDDPSTRGKTLKKELAEIVQSQNDEKIRSGTEFYLWYAHFGPVNSDLEESVENLGGKAIEIKSLEFGQVTLPSETYKLSRFAGDKSAPPSTFKFPVQAMNCVGTDLELGKPEIVENYREWTGQNGKRVLASLVKSEGASVTLRSLDGKLVTTQKAKLSAADQAYLKDPATPDAKMRFQFNTGGLRIAKVLDNKEAKVQTTDVPPGIYTVRVPVTTKSGLVIVDPPYLTARIHVKAPIIPIIGVDIVGGKAADLGGGAIDFGRGNVEAPHDRVGVRFLIGKESPQLADGDRVRLTVTTAKPLPEGIEINVATVKGNIGKFAPIPRADKDGKQLNISLPVDQSVRGFFLKLTHKPAGATLPAKWTGTLQLEHQAARPMRFGPAKIPVSLEITKLVDPIVSISPAKVNLGAIEPGSVGADTVTVRANARAVELFKSAANPIRVKLKLPNPIPKGVTIQLRDEAKITDLTPAADGTSNPHDLKISSSRLRFSVVADSTLLLPEDLEITGQLQFFAKDPRLKLPVSTVNVTARVKAGLPRIAIAPPGPVELKIAPDSPANVSLALVPNGDAKKISGPTTLSVRLDLKQANANVKFEGRVGDAGEWKEFADAAAQPDSSMITRQLDLTMEDLAGSQSIPLDMRATVGPASVSTRQVIEGAIAFADPKNRIKIEPASLPLNLQIDPRIERISLDGSTFNFSYAPSPDRKPGAFAIEFRPETLPETGTVNVQFPDGGSIAAADATGPALQLLKEGANGDATPITSEDSFAVSRQSPRINLFWILSKWKPGEQVYTFKIISDLPTFVIDPGRIRFDVTAEDTQWDTYPPAFLSEQTRRWPFEAFVPSQDATTKEATDFLFEFKLPDQETWIRGEIDTAEKEGQPGFKVSGPFALPLLDSIAVPEDTVRTDSVLFRIKPKGSDEVSRQWDRVVSVLPGGLLEPEIVFEAESGESTELLSEGPQRVLELLDGSDLNVRYHSKMRVVGGEKIVVNRRLLFVIQEPTASQVALTEETIRELLRAAEGGESAAGNIRPHLLFERNESDSGRDGTADTRQETGVTLRQPQEHWWHVTPSADTRLLFVDVLENESGQQEWQARLQELEIPGSVPLVRRAAFIGVPLLLVALIGFLVIKSRARAGYSSVLKEFLEDLKFEDNSQRVAFKPAQEVTSAWAKFIAGPPKGESLMKKIGRAFSSRSQCHTTMKLGEHLRHGRSEKDITSVVKIAAGSRGIEICASHGHDSTDKEPMEPGEWSVLAKYLESEEEASTQYARLDLNLGGGDRRETAPPDGEESDGTGSDGDAPAPLPGELVVTSVTVDIRWTPVASSVAKAPEPDEVAGDGPLPTPKVQATVAETLPPEVTGTSDASGDSPFKFKTDEGFESELEDEPIEFSSFDSSGAMQDEELTSDVAMEFKTSGSGLEEDEFGFDSFEADESPAWDESPDLETNI